MLVNIMWTNDYSSARDVLKIWEIRVINIFIHYIIFKYVFFKVLYIATVKKNYNKYTHKDKKQKRKKYLCFHEILTVINYKTWQVRNISYV